MVPGHCRSHEYVGNAFKYGVKYRVVRRPLTYYYCPALILLPYLTTICSVHFEIDTFAHNNHGGFVQFSTNLTQKRLWYRSRRLIFINIRPPVVHPPHYLNYDCFLHSYVWNIFLEEVHLWSKNNSHHSMHWKHVWKYLKQICNSLLWISFFIWLCMFISDSVHMRFWCQNIY